MSIRVQFPAVAVSPAGWVKTGNSLEEISDASAADDLREWQGLRVFDAGGNAYRADRVERSWPASRLGLVFFRLANHSVYVRLDLLPEATVPVSELAVMLGVREAPPYGTVWTSQRELVEFVCS